MGANGSIPAQATASGLILLTLSSGQFLMALDSSVMNVSIATVAEDLDTTVTSIQTAITLYMLVMACLMITGGKVERSSDASARSPGDASSTAPDRSRRRSHPI